MTFLWNGFRTWNVQACQTSREMTGDARRFATSLKAEDRLEAAILAAGHTPHMNKRIYNEESGRRREIDAIVVKDGKVVAVEVKNWAGKIWRHGRKWYQLAPKSERALEFDDITGDNAEKAKVLKVFLEKKLNTEIPDEAIVPVLVFTNPSAKLCPNSVRNMENVFTLEAFQQWLAKPLPGGSASSGWFSGLLTAVLPSWLGGGAENPSSYLTSDHCASVERSVADVKTWDTILLHNGTILTGDIQSVEIPSAKVSVQRYNIENITVQWSSNNFLGLCSAMWAGSAGFVTIELKKRKGAPPELRLPIRVSYSKDMSAIDHIVFRSAGKPHSTDVQLSQIQTLTFGSHSSVTKPSSTGGIASTIGRWVSGSR